MKWLGNVIEHWDVPHPAPEPVEKASARFEETTKAFQLARSSYYALSASRLDDLAAANTAAAKARVDQTEPPALTPSKVEKRLADAKDEMDLLERATDLTGTALVQAVAAHRAEWIKVYEAADAEATERVANLIELQRQATSDVGVARSAARWLREFSALPNQSQYPGKGRHSIAADFSTLEKIVHGERQLVGYSGGEAIWKTVKS